MTDTAIQTRDILALEHFRSERFRGRLMMAMARIEATLMEYRTPYVAFSGGKDSLVVGALAERLTGGITMHWSDGELEYPETVEYIGQFVGDPHFVFSGGRDATHGNPDFWFSPWTDPPFWREPFPGMVVRNGHSDEWMAMRKYDVTLLGTRASESNQRRRWLLTGHVTYGPSYPVRTGTGRHCCPIWDWTEDDVWALIIGWGLPYNPAYDVLERICVVRERQRIGPMTMTPRAYLADGWPDTLERLEKRYGKRWA